MEKSIEALIEQHAERVKDAARRELEAIVAESRLGEPAAKSAEDGRDGRRTSKCGFIEPGSSKF